MNTDQLYRLSARRLLSMLVPTGPLLRVEDVAWSAQRFPTAVNYVFLDRSRYFFIQLAAQLSSRSRVDPIPDALLRKSGSAGNRTPDLCICSQEL
jgi:hypothetical protein